MGVFADKDYRSVIQKTAHFADQILTIQTPDNVRALPAEKLAEAVREYNLNVRAMMSIKDAVEKAFAIAGEQSGTIPRLSGFRWKRLEMPFLQDL